MEREERAELVGEGGGTEGLVSCKKEKRGCARGGKVGGRRGGGLGVIMESGYEGTEGRLCAGERV